LTASAHQGIITSVCPALEIVITPAHAHMHVPVLSSAGMLPIMTVGAPPGIQGPTVTGMQGMGVSTPRAADVADATVGLAIEEHIPKGMMFVIGIMSMILAAGLLPAITLFVGKTISVLGAAPKLHAKDAPATTCIGMDGSLFFGMPDGPVGP
jgi:hypothetical protein